MWMTFYIFIVHFAVVAFNTRKGIKLYKSYCGEATTAAAAAATAAYSIPIQSECNMLSSELIYLSRITIIIIG